MMGNIMIRLWWTRHRCLPGPLHRLHPGREVLKPPLEFGYPSGLRILALARGSGGLGGAWLP
jgi:hypothetical protein